MKIGDLVSIPYIEGDYERIIAIITNIGENYVEAIARGGFEKEIDYGWIGDKSDVRLIIEEEKKFERKLDWSI